MTQLIEKIAMAKKPLRFFTSSPELFDRLKLFKYTWCETVQELIFCIKNKIEKAPICDLSTCDNPIKFSEANRKYNAGCCKIHTQQIEHRKKYGSEILKSSENTIQLRKQTILKRYGVENVMYLDTIKAKVRKTNIEKYGGPAPINNSEISEKIKQTCLEKYGVDNPLKSKNIQDKVQQTLIEKYGVEQLFLSQEMQQRRQTTCMEKFGVPFPLQNKDILKRVQDTKIIKYGVSFPFQSIFFQQKAAESNQGPSKWEHKICRELPDFEIEMSNRTILNGKELDIYIPEKKIAIEVNGIYWHSELCGKTKNYHLSKTEECFKNGIQLIHFYDKEIAKQFNIVMSVIKSKLGIFEKRIYARKTLVRELTTLEKNNFLNKYHLQGEDRSKIKIGLFYENELVSVMTFGKPRFNKNYEFEMHRFASKENYQIIGGASKMFSYFIRTHKPKSILTYADRRYSTGAFYLKLGFNIFGYSKPSYYYFKTASELMNRMQFQKSKLRDKLDVFNPELSEWENMQLNGYNRIWDCGHVVLEWKN